MHNIAIKKYRQTAQKSQCFFVDIFFLVHLANMQYIWYYEAVPHQTGTSREFEGGY